MIKISNCDILGWDHAIRGMRNPLNSWDKSDSNYIADTSEKYTQYDFDIGHNDLDLMKRLRNAGTDHRKFMRMITVYTDIYAPLYWWKEFDTYKVGTVSNSCSTMHKIQSKRFTLDDFSSEHLLNFTENRFKSIWNVVPAKGELLATINQLNFYHDIYNNWETHLANDEIPVGVTKKDIWWQMIQLLPSSYNQKRTVMLNYEVLANMYKSRKDHKLDEWREFCTWIKSLPYSELITGESND